MAARKPKADATTEAETAEVAPTEEPAPAVAKPVKKVRAEQRFTHNSTFASRAKARGGNKRVEDADSK